jgi:hypothetical protein
MVSGEDFPSNPLNRCSMWMHLAQTQKFPHLLYPDKTLPQRIPKNLSGWFQGCCQFFHCLPTTTIIISFAGEIQMFMQKDKWGDDSQ